MDDAVCDFNADPANLDNFNGAQPDGSWRICVADDGSGDLGTLEQAQFIITTQ